MTRRPNAGYERAFPYCEEANITHMYYIYAVRCTIEGKLDADQAGCIRRFTVKPSFIRKPFSITLYALSWSSGWVDGTGQDYMKAIACLQQREAILCHAPREVVRQVNAHVRRGRDRLRESSALPITLSRLGGKPLALQA